VTDAAFLQAIVEDPDDDTPRLVYADWLEERGDPRGEFIRAQVQMHRTPADSPGWRALYRLQDELFRTHPWKRELPRLPGVSWGAFERGFVHLVRFSSLTAFRKHAEKVFAAAPLAEVRVAALGTALLRTLATTAEAAHLRVLSLPHDLGDGDARALAASPHLTGLVHLTLGSKLGPDGVAALADSPNLARLAVLNLNGNRPLGDAGARHLACSPHLGRLRRLYLCFVGLSSDGLKALADSTALPKLMLLAVSNNQIDDAGAEALAGTPARRGLTRLHLFGNKVGDRGALALAGSPALPRLELLDLSANPVGEAGKRALRRGFGDRVRV
jgi:uncharacterized protein (TIGR02996 family)